MNESDELARWDRQLVWHPFSPMQAYREECPPIIERAAGFHLFDREGNKYIDGVASLWCNVHGHRVPAIDSAIRDQLDQCAHTTLLGMGSVAASKLAYELVKRTDGALDRVFFSDSGATAVEAAIKMAFQFHQQRRGKASKREMFVSLGGAYHGDTLGAVSVGGVDLFHAVYEKLLFPTLKVPSPVAYRTPQGMTAKEYLAYCDNLLWKTLKENHEQIAGFIIEPLVQGAAGILVHPQGYLQRVREWTRELDIPLIADEVAVGFGKTGSLFACQEENIWPDFLCLAKGLTGGYLPLAATMTTARIESEFLGAPAEKRTFFHGHTYTGNALGCAAALASLELFDTNQVLENARRIEQTLARKLESIVDLPCVGDIRQKGVMVGIELVADRASKQAFAPAERVGHQVTLLARKLGVMIRPLGDVVVLMPAPGMPTPMVEELADLVFQSIREVCSRTHGRLHL